MYVCVLTHKMKNQSAISSNGSNLLDLYVETPNFIYTKYVTRE